MRKNRSLFNTSRLTDEEQLKRGKRQYEFVDKWTGEVVFRCWAVNIDRAKRQKRYHEKVYKARMSAHQANLADLRRRYDEYLKKRGHLQTSEYDRIAKEKGVDDFNELTFFDL